MKQLFTVLLTLILSSQIIFADSAPKHEFRAVWVASVLGLDFPHTSGTTAQINEIKGLLDNLKAAGFNAVIFQVRPACDALYNSSYEPWSHELTGVSGQAPSPYYDPLEVFIEEAHARGMELHAWFNPYRVSASGNYSSLDPSHVYHQHPEWLLSIATRSSDYGGIADGVYSNSIFIASELISRDSRSESIILDPGQEEVRNYVVNVFMDVVNNYDVDAVHMDDYFYPYSGMASEDASTFAAEARGFTDIHDWRRDNINLLVEGIYDSIQVVKPWVKYGVSPFGIWKSGYPAGIVGLSSYYDIYCDPMAWLNDGTIDYLTPQLYWPFTGGQDYGSLMPWWADSVSVNGRHLYPGHAPYRIGDWHDWPSNELPRQIRLNRSTAGCQGSVMFRARNGVLNNPKGFLDSLRTDLYRYPALPPAMAWKDTIAPNSPENVTLSVNSGNKLISWERPAAASDGDSADWYVLYHFPDENLDSGNPANILAVLPGNATSYEDVIDGSNYYAVSAQDRNHNESSVAPATVLSISGEDSNQPNSLQLFANYPNPFNPSTTISFVLPERADVRLTVIDMAGREIHRLLNRALIGGFHSVSWNGTDNSGSPAAAGLYFYRLQAGESVLTGKMVLLK